MCKVQSDEFRSRYAKLMKSMSRTMGRVNSRVPVSAMNLACPDFSFTAWGRCSPSLYLGVQRFMYFFLTSSETSETLVSESWIRITISSQQALDGSFRLRPKNISSELTLCLKRISYSGFSLGSKKSSNSAPSLTSDSCQISFPSFSVSEVEMFCCIFFTDPMSPGPAANADEEGQ